MSFLNKGYISGKQLFQSHPLVRNFKLLNCDTYENLILHENARFLPIFKDRILIEKNQNLKSLVSLNLNETRSILDKFDPLLVGIHTDTKLAYFAFSVNDPLPWEVNNREFRGLRNVSLYFAQTNPDSCSIAAQAKMIVQWVNQNKFCGGCGAKADFIQALNHSLQKNCNNCGLISYPRIDPVIICLVIDSKNKRCLLGRKPTFPKGFYSALAGFLDPGESIEHACKREIFEESNILIDMKNIEIIGSQTWPMTNASAELLIGCLAYINNANEQNIILTDEEQEDVKWFSLDEIRIAVQESSRTNVINEGWSNGSGDRSSKIDFFVPPNITMAWNLLQSWVLKEDGINLRSSL